MCLGFPPIALTANSTAVMATLKATNGIDRALEAVSFVGDAAGVVQRLYDRLMVADVERVFAKGM